MTDDETQDLMAAATAADESPKEANIEGGAGSCHDTEWIEIQLVGEDEMGIAEERYELVLPNGEHRRGKTDARGIGRIENIPDGKCRVTFPNLDREAWDLLA